MTSNTNIEGDAEFDALAGISLGNLRPKLTFFSIDEEDGGAIGLENLTDFQGEGIHHLLQHRLQGFVVDHFDRPEKLLKFSGDKVEQADEFGNGKVFNSVSQDARPIQLGELSQRSQNATGVGKGHNDDCATAVWESGIRARGEVTSDRELVAVSK